MGGKVKYLIHYPPSFLSHDNRPIGRQLITKHQKYIFASTRTHQKIGAEIAVSARHM
jgi:hypothetical protein